MSRCFPYPPPGFEKKARNDRPDLLAKEQHKGKKHKKEKRDKEQKEGKESKHRDKSRHKHEEKKDRKEKHKDKKRDEDKNRLFDDDRRIEGPTGCEEKGGVSIPKVKVEEIKDSTFAQELGRRINDDTGEASRMLVKVNGVSISKLEEVKDSRFTKELAKRIKDEKGGANRMLTKVGGISNSKAEEVIDSRFIDELGKRIKDEKGEPNRIGKKGGRISISKAGEVKDSRFTEELGKRIKDENWEANRMLEKVSGLRNSTAEEVEDSRFTEDLGRRMKIKKKVAANRMLENDTSSIPNRAEGLCTSTVLQKERGNRNPMVTNFVRKEQTNATRVTQPADKVNFDPTVFTNGNTVAAANLIIKEQKRNDVICQPVEKDSHNHQTLFHQNPLASNFISTEQRRVYGIPQAVEKGIHSHQTLLKTPSAKYEVKSIEHKENGKHQEASNKHGDSHKDRENKKKTKENGKNRDKEKRREEKKRKKRENDENNHQEHDRPKDREKKDPVDDPNFNTVVSHSNNGNFAAHNAHSNKRQKIEMNGFLHEHEAPRNKLQKPASSIHQRNGRVIEFDPIPNNIKAGVMMNNKIHSIKDSAQAKASPADLRQPLAADTGGKREKITKPPHPDSRFLSQICSIPKIEMLPEHDNQEWLSGSGGHQPKCKEEFEAEETPQVWAQGMKIESADVFALPYVIPY